MHIIPASKRDLLEGIKTGLQDCRLVFLDIEAIEIIRKLLVTKGSYSASYYASMNPDGSYNRLSSAEFHIIDEIVSEALFALSGDEMSCGQDIKIALEGITAAIQEQTAAAAAAGGCGGDSCGKGSAGAGGEPASPEIFIDDGSTTFPPNFPSRTAYENKKCGVARTIINDLINDLSWLETASLVSITTTGLVGAFLTPIPGARIAALVGLAIGLTLQGLLIGAVQSIIASLQAQEDDLVCAMINAETSTLAQSEFSAEVSGLNAVEVEILDYFVKNSDSFNRLFDFGSTPLGLGDCTGCPEALEWCDLWLEWGTLVTTNGNTHIEVWSEGNGSQEVVVINLNRSTCPEEKCGPTNPPLVTVQHFHHVDDPLTLNSQFKLTDSECDIIFEYDNNTIPANNNPSGSQTCDRLEFYGKAGNAFRIKLDIV